MTEKIKLIGVLALFFSLFGGGSAKAISISPPVMEIEANSGDSIERVIEVGNGTDQERSYSIGVKKFEITGEEGMQSFISVEGDDDFGLTSWIKYEDEKIVVPPMGSNKFVFTIDVPENADSGGHYASIYFDTGTPTEDESSDGNSKVGVAAQIHSLILVRISGEIIEKAEIEGFGIEKAEKLINRIPVQFIWRLKNNGNVHIRAQGNIEIKNMLGEKVTLLDANPKNYRVLPGNIRKIESWWGDSSDAGEDKSSFFQEAKKEFDNFAIGKYTAKLDMVYGKDNGNFLSKEINFWIFPWRIALIFLIILICFAITAVLMVKKYNRWIVKKHIKLRQ
ncbi:MAG: hypothetical protein P1P85_05760 [Patescibacteria group bacterium]|nr:hypothetical protein [Patescibacteria group bacterium]